MDSIMTRICFPFAQIPAFHGYGDVHYTLICQQTSQSNLVGDEVYFAPGSAPHSYAVYMDRTDALSQEDIHAFLKAKDPQLYAKLFRPGPQPLQQQPASFSENQSLSPRWPKKLYTTPVQRSAGLIELSDYKTFLIRALLNCHRLVLRKTQLEGPIIHCANPICCYHISAMRPGTYFLNLTTDVMTSYQSLQVPIFMAQFCLGCIETLFDTSKDTSAPQEESPELIVIDGTCDDADILQAVNRLMPQGVHSAKPVSLDHGILAFKYPPNTPEELYCRRIRDEEIDEILQHVKRYETIKSPPMAIPEETPSMCIRRRKDIPPPKDRYKKQGRRRSDRDKQRLTLDGKLIEAQVNPNKRKAVDEGSEYICCCHEPEGEEAVICCDSEWCPIGWFHLDCVEVDESKSFTDPWYCGECSPYFDSSSAHEDVLSDSDQPATDEIDATDMEDGFADDDMSEISAASDTLITNSPELPSANCFTPVNANMTDVLDGTASPARDHFRSLPDMQNLPNQPDVPFEAVTLADLGPFIHIELNSDFSSSPGSALAPDNGLTLHHLAALEQWKALCPPSRLLWFRTQSEPSSATFGTTPTYDISTTASMAESMSAITYSEHDPTLPAVPGSRASQTIPQKRDSSCLDDTIDLTSDGSPVQDTFFYETPADYSFIPPQLLNAFNDTCTRPNKRKTWPPMTSTTERKIDAETVHRQAVVKLSTVLADVDRQQGFDVDKMEEEAIIGDVAGVENELLRKGRYLEEDVDGDDNGAGEGEYVPMLLSEAVPPKHRRRGR